MGLIVAAPAPVGIRTYSNGIKIVRLHEYMGAVRATLTAVTDPLSPAGRAVKDTQSLAQATTFTNRASSVANTVSIPIDDLEIGAEASYNTYLSLRRVGRPPVGARAGEVWTEQSATCGPTVCRMHDSTLFDSYEIPREYYAGYTVIFIGSFSDYWFGGATNVSFRAYGIDGGGMEFYLDLLYMIPVGLADTDSASAFSAGDFPPLGLFGGAPDPDEDNNTGNSIGSAQSVMPGRGDDSVWESFVAFDLQDSDYEKSEVDWNHIFVTDPGDPIIKTSFGVFLGASRLLDPHTLVTNDFSAWPGPTPPVGPFGHPAVVELPEGYTLEGIASNVSGVSSAWGSSPNAGWFLFNSALRYVGTAAADPHGTTAWSVGTLTVRPTPVSGAGPSDPRNVAPLLQGMDSFVSLYKVNLLMSHVGGDVEMHFGGGRWSAINTAHQTRITNTAKVTHHPGGTTHSIALTAYADDVSSTNIIDFAGPVTALSGLSPGDSYWVRVEKRYNQWRARCWIDGNAEPSTWDVEGFAPGWVHRSSVVGMINVDYPYNLNWPPDATFHFEDARYWYGAPQFGSNWTPWMHEGRIYLTAGFTTPNYEIEIAEFTLSYDPDLDDDGGAHTGAYFRLEKWDGSEDWGTAYVPPGAWRILFTNFAEHHFDWTAFEAADTHGGNLYAWKETGALPLQVAAWGNFNFRHPVAVAARGDITYP